VPQHAHLLRPANGYHPQFNYYLIMNKLLSTREVCEIFRTNRKTLHDWKQKGIIPYFTVGGKHFYESDKIDNLINGGQHDGK
jgi:hypothetical protein